MNPSQIRISPLLSKLAVRYTNKGFVADQIFKPVEVPLESGKYPTFDSDVTFRVHDTEMAYHASANEIDMSASLTDFTLTTRALKTFIDPAELKMAGDMPVRAAKVEMLMESMKLALEVEVAALMANATVFTQGETLSGTAQWSDYTNSDPRSKILSTQQAALVKYNVAIMSDYGFNKLLLHTKIQDAIKYTSAAWKVEEILASYLNVDRIIVGSAKKATNKKGQPQVLADVWGKHVILAHIPNEAPSPLMDKPACGYLPVSNGGGGLTYKVYTWRDPDRGTGEGAEGIKVETVTKPLVSAPTFAYRLTNAFA